MQEEQYEERKDAQPDAQDIPETECEPGGMPLEIHHHGHQGEDDKRHALEFYLLGDHYKDKSIDTNREGSSSWEKNGLVLKAIDWHVGNLMTAGVGYKWSF